MAAMLITSRCVRAGDRGGHRDRRGQVAVVDAVVLGEHDGCEAALVGPGDCSRQAAYSSAGVAGEMSGTRRSKRIVKAGTVHWHTPYENGLQFADIVSET